MLAFVNKALPRLSPQDKQTGHGVLYFYSLRARNLPIKRRASPDRLFRCANAVGKLALICFENRILV